jgi:ABC-type branched-subunit amino acid transport system substrate-binding protein
MYVNRRQFSVTSAAVLMAGFNTVCAHSDDKIVLGQSVPLTDPAAQLGIQLQQGARVYFDQVNARGGVNKRLIELRTRDDGYEPDRCAENTRKLLADDVFPLFDFVGTSTSVVALLQVMPSPYSAARPIVRELQDAVKAAGKGVNANFSSMEGYLAARVFVEGLMRVRAKPTRESLIGGLEAVGTQSIGGFNLAFGPNDHVASKFVEMSLLTGDGRVRTRFGRGGNTALLS